jgi:hypothetical protein
LYLEWLYELYWAIASGGKFVDMNVPGMGCFKMKQAASYAGISERTLHDWLKRGLRHSRLTTGIILIKVQWIDEFLEGFEVKSMQVDSIVDDSLKKFKRSQSL